MGKPTLTYQTPVGDLNWMFISGEGKEDLNNNLRFSGAVYFEEETAQLKALIDKLLGFWEEHKPKGSRKPKSIGVYYEVKIPDDKNPGEFKLSQSSYTRPLEDEMEKTGRIIVSAWTGVTWPDGKAKVVKVYNAQALPVSLGDKVIGSGSRGALAGVMAIYDNGGNKGVSLYLNGVIISKFVEYVGNDVAEALEDDEDGGWTGSDLSEDGIEPVSDNDDIPGSTVKPKVKL